MVWLLKKELKLFILSRSDFLLAMTILIGINFGGYVLLAADTRTTHCTNGSVDYVADDNAKKIQKTTLGLIAGAGSWDIIRRVKNKLQKQEITDINQILSIIEKEKLHHQRCGGPAAEKAIEITRWICSYSKIDDGNPKLRLNTINSTVENGLGLYQDVGDDLVPFTVIMPEEVTHAEDRITIVQNLRKAIALAMAYEPSFDNVLFDSASYNWLTIVQLIRNIIRKLYDYIIRNIQPIPSISPDCLIGIHMLDGQMGISSKLKGTDISDIDVSALITWDP